VTAHSVIPGAFALNAPFLVADPDACREALVIMARQALARVKHRIARIKRKTARRSRMARKQRRGWA
jgi:hypothetical protein